MWQQISVNKNVHAACANLCTLRKLHCVVEDPATTTATETRATSQVAIAVNMSTHT